jgi:hypothetical protein
MSQAEKCHSALQSIVTLREVLAHAQKASQRHELFNASESGQLKEAMFYFEDGSTLNVDVYGPEKWRFSVTASKPADKH